MILAQIIHYTDTNSVEATWVDEAGVPIKCHSYADSQMDMLEADLGADALEHATLIALVRSTAVPVVVPDPVPGIELSIKAERDKRRFEGGVKVGELWFLSTAVAMAEYTALAVISSGLPGDTVLRSTWRTMTPGVVVDMTPNLVRQILSAGFAAVAAIDDASQTHINAMTLSADPAAYDYSAGWPEHFPI